MALKAGADREAPIHRASRMSLVLLWIAPAPGRLLNGNVLTCPQNGISCLQDEQMLRTPGAMWQRPERRGYRERWIGW